MSFGDNAAQAPPGSRNPATSSRVLLLGPAGCGKSRRLRERLVAAAAKASAAAGALDGAVQAGGEQQSLLIVPTSSYRDHTRNLVLRESELPGSSGTAVCTFRDLLNRVAPGGRAISTARRELMVRRLLNELALPEFARVRDFAGFRAALADAAEEARAAGLDPDRLEAALGEPEAQRRAFLRFFRAYDTALSAAGADDRARLQDALEALRRGAAFSLLLVDGFSDFTFEQQALLEVLIERTPEAHIALTLDRTPRELFYQAERSRAWLTGKGFAEVWLEGNHRAREQALAAVEATLREGGAEPLPPLFANAAPLTLTAAADRQDECELMAREIVRLVRDEGYRYRDIGIIVRQPAQYVGRLRDTFRRLDIPLRAFFRVPAAETAAGRHFRLCLDLFVPGSRPESLIEWLKSPYGTVSSRFAIECFEYRAIERLASAREGHWSAVLKPDDRMLLTVRQVAAFDSEAQSPRNLLQWAGWARRLWERLAREPEPDDGQAPERVLQLRAEAAAFRGIPALLEELAKAADSEAPDAIPFESFREIVLSLLAAEQLPLRDRRQDAVNLMNPFEARQWELGAVFVPGLLEKEFPAPVTEALFLGDGDRQKVRAAAQRWLATSADRPRDECLLFYVAATRARSRLYLSYPQADAGGSELLSSFFLRDLGVLLRSAACAKRFRRRADVVVDPGSAATPADALGFVHAEFSRWPERPQLRVAAAAYESLRERGLRATEQAARALTSHPPVLELEAALELLRGRATRFSASDLKKFAGCPFRYFAERTLKLKGPPAPSEIDWALQGEIVHRAIQEWERGDRACPIAGVLDEAFDTTLEQKGIPAGHEAARIREQMRAALCRFAAAEDLHDATYRTAVDPAFAELRFGAVRPEAPVSDGARRGGPEAPVLDGARRGGPEAPVLDGVRRGGPEAPVSDGGKEGPQLQVVLPDGVCVSIPGRFDRVEFAQVGGQKLGLLVDYKYNKAEFDVSKLKEIREGGDLQIPIYLLALERLFGLVPAGAELYPLKAEDGARGGVFDEALAGEIFRGAPPETASLLPGETFRALISEGEVWIQRHAAAIRGGQIAVMAESDRHCKQCQFQDLCRIGSWQSRQEIREKRATAT